MNEKGNVTEYPAKKPIITEIHYIANNSIVIFEIKRNINTIDSF